MQCGQTNQFYALTLKSCMMFKKDLKWNVNAVYFSSGVYWSVWWFKIHLVITLGDCTFTYIFHDVSWFAVGFKWNYKSGMFYCEHYFVCFIYRFRFVFFLFECLTEKESFPLVCVLWLLHLCIIPSFNVIVYNNQGAVQLSTKLSTRSIALKSALEGKIECTHEFNESGGIWKLYAILSHPLWIQCFVGFILLGYVKLKCSMMRCPQPCTA